MPFKHSVEEQSCIHIFLYTTKKSSYVQPHTQTKANFKRLCGVTQPKSTDVAVSSLYLLPYGFSSSGSHLNPFESPPSPSLLGSL